MKQNILAALASLFFVACQNEIPQQTAVGSLEFESIEIAASSHETLSRAIDADLTVEIWKDGSIYQDGKMTYRFTNENFPKAIYLPVGTYQIKAFDKNYQESPKWTNEELGVAMYYKEQNVQISDQKVAKIAMKVPMSNIGVTFSLPVGFNESFSEYTFTVAEASENQTALRSVSIKSPATVYLNASAFKVTLQALNRDNEAVSTSLTHTDVQPGTIYTIAYEVASSSISSVVETK